MTGSAIESELDVPTVYLETSACGSLAPRQPADRKQAVRRLLSLLDGVRGRCVVSTTVYEEVEASPPAVVEAILKHLDILGPTIHGITVEVEQLAQAYLANKVLPERRSADALHVAAATVYGCDYLVSWNHRHLTRPQKKLQFQGVNQLHGYLKSPLICNPLEACHELRHR